MRWSFGRIALGYLAAVAMATLVFEAILYLPEVLNPANEAVWTELRDAFNLFPIVVGFSFFFALPGFILIMLLLASAGRTGWCIFAIAGGANELVSVAVFSLIIDAVPQMPAPGFVLSSLAAGVAGGLACRAVLARGRTARPAVGEAGAGNDREARR